MWYLKWQASSKTNRDQYVSSGDLGQQGAAGHAGAGAPAKETVSLEAPRKRLKMEAQPDPQPAPQEPSSSSELAAVDFMSSDEEVHQPGPALGTRFDSSEDEEVPALPTQLHNDLTAMPQLPAKHSLSNQADHCASDHIDKADSSGNSEASIDKKLPQSKCLGDHLAGATEGEGSEISVEEVADSSDSASDSDDAAADEDDSSPQGDAVALEPLATVTGDKEVDDASEPEDDALHTSAMEASGAIEASSPAVQPAALHEHDPDWRGE